MVHDRGFHPREPWPGLDARYRPPGEGPAAGRASRWRHGHPDDPSGGRPSAGRAHGCLASGHFIAEGTLAEMRHERYGRGGGRWRCITDEVPIRRRMDGGRLDPLARPTTVRLAGAAMG